MSPSGGGEHTLDGGVDYVSGKQLHKWLSMGMYILTCVVGKLEADLVVAGWVSASVHVVASYMNLPLASASVGDEVATLLLGAIRY